MLQSIDRRKFLTNAGIGLALPALGSRFSCEAAENPDDQKKLDRLVCIGTYLGFHQASFFPSETGKDYDNSLVLSPLESFRNEMTIFSGLDHRGRNGHEGWKAWMTGTAIGSVSMDEIVAQKIGDQTRFASLQVTCGEPPSQARVSFTREGVALPMIGRPSVLYETLFRSDSDKARIRYLLRTNQSVLDGLMEEANGLRSQLGFEDQHKLGEYLASIRSVEKLLQKQQVWLDQPTPKSDYKLPEFDPVAPDLALECESIMYDLMALALTTDSTRVITFLVPGWSQVFTIGDRKLSAGYHGLSHHGNDAKKIKEYNLVGIEHVRRFEKFLQVLRSTKDIDGRPLLDTTAIIFGSGMGDSNTHDNSNLPTLLVGGGFQHGTHHHFQRNAPSTRLLGDLFLSVMKQFGISIENFAGARHNLDEVLL